MDEPSNWNEAMDAHRNDDSVAREIRSFELARRLIFHEVRTQTIRKLTGFSRNRLATLRRRLKVSDDARRHGPPPRSLDVLLRTARGRTEAAAVAALFPIFKHPASIQRTSALDDGEQTCDIYDAYLAYYPQSNVRFEELMLLRRTLAKGDLLELGLCRVCKGLIMNIRIDRCRPVCAHCNSHNESEQDPTFFDEKTTALS